MSEAPTLTRLTRLPVIAVPAGVHDKCARCGGLCCTYFALQIDSPRTYDDFDDMRWYLAHVGVQVYKEGRRWYLQVGQPCRHLGDDGLCGIYTTRPKICSDHKVEGCEFENDEPFSYDIHFRSDADVMTYLERRWPKGRPKRLGRRRRRALPKSLRFP